MRASEPKKQNAVTRVPKQPVIYDFQFYPKELNELLEKETEAFLVEFL